MKLTACGRFTDCRLAGNILREETVNGRRHIVVPVVAMVEGVHQGITSPNQPGPRSFYPFDVLSRAAESLEGLPVTVDHPMTATELVSASSPEGQPFVTGLVRNVRAQNNRVQAEAWLDFETLITMSAKTIADLNAGVPVEVSLGVYGTVTTTQGVWNGEAYDEVFTNIRFDHLALLPGAKGACSWDDGCGVRANKTVEIPKEICMKTKWNLLNALIGRKSTRPADTKEATVNALISGKQYPFKEEDREWLTSLADKQLTIIANEMSHDDTQRALWDFVNGLDNPEFINFLEEVYDGYFIYRTSRRDHMTGATVASALYKRSFSIDESNAKVIVADDAVEVKEETKYVPVETTTANVTLNQENAVKEQLIKDLIACDRTPFKDEDRSWMTNLSECQLKNLQADNFKPVPAPTVAAAAPAAPTPAAAPVADLVAASKPKTVEEALASLPAEMASTIKGAMARDAANKTALITKITANAGCPWTKEELELKDFGELQKVAAAAKIEFDVTADYSGQAGATRVNEGPKVPPMPSSAPKPMGAAAK